MPIWSLTQERVDKLKDQMASKKDEHDALERLSEKDLWVTDLDAFVAEWDLQLKEQAEYEKGIRNTNRRVSRKIGAGKGAKSKSKNDDDYNPKPAKVAVARPNIAKGVVKVENKPSQRFAEMFAQKPKPKAKPVFGLDGADDYDEDAMSGMSDDDFDALRTSKSSKDTTSKESSVAPSNGPTNGRSKRAAAAAPKNWVIDDDEESESDDGKLLGDIGDMVKGIGASGNDDTLAATGRVSLHQGRPTSSHGVSNDLPKVKSKPSKIFNISDDDETNYDMLAASSPRKAPQRDDLDSFLSDDDAPLPVKKAPAKPAAKAPIVKPVAKKVTKPKAVEKPAAVSKPIALSPAAKAYAAKQSKLNFSRDVFSNDEDEDMSDVPAPKATSRAKESALSDSEDEDMDDAPPVKSKPAARPVAKSKVAPAKKSALSESEDEDMDDAPPVKSKTVSKPAPKAKAAPAAKKPAPKKKSAISDDEVNLDLSDEASPPPRVAAAGRGRPARAAVAAAKKSIYVDNEDEEEEAGDFDESAVVEEDEESEDYE